MSYKKLEELYGEVDRCIFCKKAGNALQHIHGYGALHPRLMLVLVNPTYRNLSSTSSNKGPRFPFIGVRHFWRVLADGGLIHKEVAYGLPLSSGWQEVHTEQLQKELVDNKLFLTNVVKCCYDHSRYPNADVIEAQQKLLAREIAIVKPQRIVALGGLVFRVLTGENVVLSDMWKSEVEHRAKERLSGFDVEVVPCYFPTGRGNPKRAAHILKNASIEV